MPRSLAVAPLAVTLALATACCSPGKSGADGGSGTTGGIPSAGPLGGKFVTTNQADGTLSVVEPTGCKFDGPILTPVIVEQNMEMPHEISMDPNGQFFVICYMEMPASDRAALAQGASEIAMMNSTIPGYLLKLSAKDGSLLGKVQVEPDPGDNALSPDGTVAYVSHFNQPAVIAAETAGVTDPTKMYADLYAIDTASMAVLAKVPTCPEAHVIELSPDGKRLYVTCLDDEVSVIDVSNERAPVKLQNVQELPGGEELPSSASLSPYALQTSPLDGSVWVSNWGSKDLRIMDATKLQFVQTVQTPGGALPVFTTFTADGKTAYNAHQQPDGVAVYSWNGQSAALVTDLTMPASDCQNPHQIVLSADEKTGYVLCEGDHVHPGQFVTLDLTTHAVVCSQAIGIYPIEMDLMPMPSGG